MAAFRMRGRASTPPLLMKVSCLTVVVATTVLMDGPQVRLMLFITAANWLTG